MKYFSIVLRKFWKSIYYENNYFSNIDLVFYLTAYSKNLKLIFMKVKILINKIM